MCSSKTNYCINVGWLHLPIDCLDSSWGSDGADSCGPEAVSNFKAYDWLEADDPALFSDEFSDLEGWEL